MCVTKEVSIGLSVGLAVVLSAAGLGKSDKPQVGDASPALQIKTLLQAPEGAEASLNAFKGKVVVIEFWATWCVPCLEAIPHLNELSEQFKDQPVQFLAVTKEDEKVVRPFLKSRSVRAWVGLDVDKSTFGSFGVEGFPQMVVLDKTGKIAAIIRPGQLNARILQDLLDGKKLTRAQSTEDPAFNLQADQYAKNLGDAKTGLFEILIRPSVRKTPNEFPLSDPDHVVLPKLTVLNFLSSSYGISSVRIVTNIAMPLGRFDFEAQTPKGSGTAARWLREAAASAFELQVERQKRKMDVFILSVAKKGAPGLISAKQSVAETASYIGRGHIEEINGTGAEIAGSLEMAIGKPVIDESGLTNHYDCELKWQDGGDKREKSEVIAKALSDQLGLELKVAQRDVEILVVSRKMN